MTIEISAVTARRYVMGRSGLWPGRRWRGLDGAGAAMRAMEDLQLDPLVVVARAHDLMLHSRVADYAIDDWATLTYERREFFEWGGWLAVRPMEELPYFRVAHAPRARAGPLARGRTRPPRRDRGDARRCCAPVARSATASSTMRDRTRIDHYRGRKDSALALHYLWRVGEAMVTRRDRFERVYALTEAVAPASALREVDDAEADDVLARKAVAAAGLTRLNGIKSAYVYGHKATPPSWPSCARRWLADGSLVEVRVEGWRATQVALGADADGPGRARGGPRARRPGRRSRRRPTRRRPSCRRSIRSARAVAPSRCSGSTTSGRSTSRSTSAGSATTRCRSCGATGSSGGSTRSWTGRPARSSSSACGWRTRRWRATAHFADALALGMARFVRLLGARRIDVGAVPQPALRKRLRASRVVAGILTRTAGRSVPDRLEGPRGYAERCRAARDHRDRLRLGRLAGGHLRLHRRASCGGSTSPAARRSTSSRRSSSRRRRSACRCSWPSSWRRTGHALRLFALYVASKSQ